MIKYVEKYLKHGLIIILCLSFITNSFAAIVSDNDGSAFVTKAEFDALKKNFSSQIDNYNESIDKKIDGAIAAYLAGLAGKKVLLDCVYDNYKLVGNVDTTLKWCSDNNKTLCGASSQYLAYDYTYVQSYGGGWDTGKEWIGVGGWWHKTMDLESNNRAKKRYKLNKEGRIDGRYLVKCWWNGTMAGAIYINGNGPGGAWFTNEALAKVDTREPKNYLYAIGYDTYHNNWWGAHNFNYQEVYGKTNENVAVYPLSEGENEYVVDMSVAVPTITAGSRQNLRTDSEIGFTISNQNQMGNFNLFTANGNPSDYMRGTISGIFKKVKLADLKYQNFYDVNKANDMIKAGVVIADLDSVGDLEIKGKCSNDGYVILYVAKDADPLWKGQRTSVTDISSWKVTKNAVTANKTWTRKIEEEIEKGSKLFMLYLPTSTSVYGTVNIESIIQTLEI